MPSSSSSAFTLVEVFVAISVMAVLSVAIPPALLAMNSYATVARLNTLASAIALNQIELVSTDAPFSPPDDQIPVDLIVGTQRAPVIVYDDPNSETTVTGTMTTTVEDPSYWQNGYNLYLRRITVSVSYQFRNRSYMVRLRTIRASDV